MVGCISTTLAACIYLNKSPLLQTKYQGWAKPTVKLHQQIFSMVHIIIPVDYLALQKRNNRNPFVNINCMPVHGGEYY